MNILITGAGLIGCHAARRLVDGGHRVVLLDSSPDPDYIRSVVGANNEPTVISADVRDLPGLIRALREHEIDTVVHTAGLIGSNVSAQPFTGFDVNVQGSVHVAEAVSLLKLRRLVYLSTFGAYDWDAPASGPIGEEFPLRGSGPYAATKAATEQLLGAWSGLYGFELIVLRPSGVFGRGHYRGGSTVGIVMNDLVLGALRGRPVRVPENKLGVNEYVYVKDVAQAVEKACLVPTVASRAFNVGTGILWSAEEIADKLSGIADGTKVTLVPAGPGDKVTRRNQPLDLSRSRAELGYEPAFSLEAALADYVRELRS